MNEINKMTTKKQPLVSIIIPCYNSQNYIQKTLDSVFNQTYENIELVVIDDGSQDDTVKILKSNKLQNTNMVIIEQENSYCIIARQNSCKYANGEYFVFLDSDDVLHEDYVRKCVKIFDNYQDVSIVYSKAMLFDKVNKEWELPEFELKKFLVSNCIYITAMIKSKDFQQVGGFDLSLTHFEDWDLFIKIIKMGGEVFRIPEYLFFYRQRSEGGSISDTADKKKISDNLFKIYSKHYEYYVENGLYLQDFFALYYEKQRLIEAEDNKTISKFDMLRYRFFKPEKYNRLKNKFHIQ